MSEIKKPLDPAKDVILFIDDNAADYHMFMESMNHINFKPPITWIDNGDKALQYLSGKSANPTLVILDLNLPGVNGHSVLKYIKSEKEKRKIPVIIFSSSDHRRDIELSYQNYANSYVRKPDCFDAYLSFASEIRSYWFGTVNLPDR
jgi:DNA-binding response OmpR family regulator